MSIESERARRAGSQAAHDAHVRMFQQRYGRSDVQHTRADPPRRSDYGWGSLQSRSLARDRADVAYRSGITTTAAVKGSALEASAKPDHTVPSGSNETFEAGPVRFVSERSTGRMP